MNDEGRRADICLVVPPFTTVDYPAFGISVLTRACRARGMGVRQVYGNITLAARLGYETYSAIGRAPLAAMLGERLFVRHAYSPEEQERLGTFTPAAPGQQALLDRVTDEIGPFLETLTDDILAAAPRIVGFTSTFQQNLATVALARSIKRRAPEIRLVVGGPNAAMPMGAALADIFPWIDHFFAGEADIEFPAFCERVLNGAGDDEPRLIQCEPIRDMSLVNGPDFSFYYEALRPHQESGALPDHLPWTVPLESSRGCWWGAKNHCTFCGLNFETMDFRRRPPERLLGEIEELVERWGARRISFTDNIMPLDYVETLFPALETLSPQPSLFYEVKANLKDEQLDAMVRGGVDSIQPGIESLSSRTLALMRKGVSALQNVALLRACRARSIHVVWSHLFGFPGELPEDYEAVMLLVPKIEHLEPPGNVQRISIDRYSPFHAAPEKLGIGRLTPFRNYQGLYPRDAPLADLAYHFTGDYSTAFIDDRKSLSAFQTVLSQWMEAWHRDRPVLQLIDRGGSQVAVVDTRALAEEKLIVLSRSAERALAYFERPRARAGHPPEIEAEVESLLQRNLLIEHENKLLSVVVRPAAAYMREKNVAEAA